MSVQQREKVQALLREDLVPHARSYSSCALNPGVFGRNSLQFAGDFFEWDGFSAFATGGNHDAGDAFLDKIRASGAKASGE